MELHNMCHISQAFIRLEITTPSGVNHAYTNIASYFYCSHLV